MKKYFEIFQVVTGAVGLALLFGSIIYLAATHQLPEITPFEAAVLLQ